MSASAVGLSSRTLNQIGSEALDPSVCPQFMGIQLSPWSQLSQGSKKAVDFHFVQEFHCCGNKSDDFSPLEV